jgi:hypothetical protein
MLLLYRLLRRRKYRQQRARRFDAAHPPAPLRWRPRLRVYGLVTGVVGGLGSVVLLAQYGIEPVTTRAFSIRGLVGGALSGIVLPSAIFAVVVWRFNRRLRRRGLHPGRRAPAKAPLPAAMLACTACAGLLFVVLAGAAQAAVTGPCTAALAGVDARGIGTASASDAVEVPEDGAVSYFMEAPDELRRWHFWIEYGPFSQLIASGTEDPDNPNDLGLGLDRDDDFLAIDPDSLLNETIVEGNSVRGAVEPSEFAWMGVGLYEVHGAVTTMSGTQCSGTVLIDVQGNPLASVLGVVGATTAAVGAAGAVGVTVGGLRDGGELLDSLEHYEAGDGTGANGDEDADWQAAELAERERIRREVMGAAEAGWEQRKVGFDAARAAQDAAMLAEIRAGRAAIEQADSYLARREAILARLEAGEAEQAELDEWDEVWRTVRDDAFDGMVRDVDSLPEFVREAGAATRQRLGEAWDTLTDPETWRVVGEAAAETAYDATGLAAGGAWGDGARDALESFHDAKELAGQLANAAAKDPWGFVKQLTPLQALEDALDPDKPLGERLVAVGTATIDIGLTLAGGKLVTAAEQLDDLRDASRLAGAADDARDASRLAGAADDAQDALQARRTAWAEARVQGQRNVDGFAGAVRGGSDDLKEAALRVQANKQSLGTMKHVPDDLKVAFNKEMRAVYDATDDHVLGRVVERHGIGELVPDPDLSKPGLKVYRDPATGTIVELFEPTNPKPGISVGADRDFTVYVTKPGAPRVSLPHDEVREWYADGFYRAMGGDEMAGRLGLPPDKYAVLERLDQAVTSDLHPEAYRNVDAVLKRPWAQIGDAQQVGEAAAFKGDHLFERAEMLRSVDPAAAEDWMAEGARQLTKQWDNQVVGRHDALSRQVEYLQSNGVLADAYQVKPLPPTLQEAVSVMKQVQEFGLSPADMERRLAAMGLTPRDVSREIGEYLHTMEALRPGPVRDLAEQMATNPELVAQVMSR